MFGSFIRYLLRRQPLNALLVLPLLPVIALALLIKGRAARWPMSLLLWGCTFGRSEARLKAHQADFVRWFRSNVTAFPLVQQRLTTYLLSSDADIWLITGSPQSLVEQVYFDTPWLPRVNLIASKMARGYGGWVLTLRCLGHEKVTQLERHIGAPLKLYRSGSYPYQYFRTIESTETVPGFVLIFLTDAHIIGLYVRTGVMG